MVLIIPPFWVKMDSPLTLALRGSLIAIALLATTTLVVAALVVQLDYRSCGRTRIINLATNQKGYGTFETTVGKLSARRIRFCPVYFCLGIILKVILNNFQNNA